jgi:hypothetical protein
MTCKGAKVSKTLGELILLDPVDVPKKKHLLAAAERLLKDYEILASYGSKTKSEESEGFDVVADFLKILTQKVKE